MQPIIHMFIVNNIISFEINLRLSHNIVQRDYDVSLPHNKIPDRLCQLAKRMAATAMPAGEEFQPEAAIVNYFGSGEELSRGNHCLLHLLLVTHQLFDIFFELW